MHVFKRTVCTSMHAYYIVVSHSQHKIGGPIGVLKPALYTGTRRESLNMYWSTLVFSPESHLYDISVYSILYTVY